MSTESTIDVLNRLLSALEAHLPGDATSGDADPPVLASTIPIPPDAIDRALHAPPRTSAVESLRNHPAVAAFREELINGFVRADTARQLLVLVERLLAAPTTR